MIYTPSKNRKINYQDWIQESEDLCRQFDNQLE